MEQTRIGRYPAVVFVRTTTTGRGLARGLIVAAVLMAIAPTPAQAQFGMLKRLKKAVSAPDSSARATDSLAQIAAGVRPDSVKIGRGLLARGVSAASSASNKMEAVTGISAKDAALAATGIGASGLIARKIGVDPMSMGQQAIANAKARGQQRAMSPAGIAGGIGGPGNGAVMAQMQQMQAMQQVQTSIAQAGAVRAKGRGASVAAGPGATGLGMAGIAGYTQADAEALVAFQQEMMQVAMAASAGDATAKARLEAWQTLTLKHEGEIQRLSTAANAGDMSAIQKLQMMQFTIMKEWANTAGTKSKIMKSIRP